MASLQLLMGLLLCSKSLPFRPKVVSLNKSNRQAGFALKKEPDLLWWKSEWLPGFCSKLEELYKTRGGSCEGVHS